MMSEGSSFFKGLVLGGVFCLVLSLLGTFSPTIPLHGEEHHDHHHHLKPLSKEEMQKLSETEKSELTQQVRVYCVIMVTPKNLVHWVAVNDTWSKHCDKAVFYTSESAKVIDAIDMQEKDEWIRLRKAIIHAYEHADGLRWFFIARPTTFSIIENLKYLVLVKDPSQPFYIGHVQKSGELEYVEYDSGIVLSYEAVKRLTEVFKNEEICPEQGYSLWKMSEEKQLAACLKFSGVFAENGEDAHGKGLFNKKSVYTLISDSMSQNPADVVEACCSDMSITYGDMSPSQMQLMMYGVYRLRAYGHNFHDSLMFLPPKNSNND
ncbi:C1GALT1-specific chaperone 1 [Tachysurus fulvidraco]|uniref:C1GALT1-specific chaperone 1 n=1 Tax=Tachysurus fulvidraco TaxID=1234273 RepID=UPI000F50F87E|nr:C1GALT1-specific chaperone 1 [Tachysurus fulvidraco]